MPGSDVIESIPGFGAPGGGSAVNDPIRPLSVLNDNRQPDHIGRQLERRIYGDAQTAERRLFFRTDIKLTHGGLPPDHFPRRVPLYNQFLKRPE